MPQWLLKSGFQEKPSPQSSISTVTKPRRGKRERLLVLGKLGQTGKEGAASFPLGTCFFSGEALTQRSGWLLLLPLLQVFTQMPLFLRATFTAQII
jgi:hypothetical protein